MSWKKGIWTALFVVAVGLLTKDFVFPPKVGELKVTETAEVPCISPSLDGPALSRQELLATLALSPATPFPAGVPWAASYKVGDANLFPLEMILHYQPVLFFQLCLDKYDRNVASYSTTFVKQETVKGKKLNPEKIKVAFREQPFSVLFNWQEGAGLAKNVLYVQGQNDDHMRVRANVPLLSLTILNKPVDGSEAKGAGRYTIKQFGLKQALERTLDSMQKAQERGTLHIRYEGQVKVDRLRDRVCHKFVRTPYNPVEEEGLNELVLYIDSEMWLQTGSILRDIKGNVIAEYFFDELELNPTFQANVFTDKSI